MPKEWHFECAVWVCWRLGSIPWAPVLVVGVCGTLSHSLKMRQHFSPVLLMCVCVLSWHVLFSPVQAAPGEEWIAQPGFRVAVDTTGYDYPVSIAFVPRPSDHPTAPLYYVAELHGRIKVVTRQRTVHMYAENLLNFKPGLDASKTGGDIGLVGCVLTR